MIRTRTPILAALLAAGLAFAPALEAQYFTSFGKNKVRYDDFEWQIYHSPHFDVHFYPEEEHLLQKVVSFAESAYDQLSREFDFQIQEPTPLIFYKTHSEFEQNNIILNFIPEGTGAFATPARNRMVLPVDLPDEELMALLLHELTHIFQYHILFGSSVSRSITARPPQWVMEGMASYMADDEQAHDKMFLRDAVVNDNIPPVAQANAVRGYFSYRLGHAVFDYIEERWGREGFLDFVYELRNTIGARPGRAMERAFRITPEDFDTDFRRWLRKKYLRQLVDTGEPGDFGRPFRVADNPRTQEISPVASPSGDLLAAVSVQRGDLDIVLFDGRRRTQIRNLTKGLDNEYEYLVAQGLSVPRRMGRDLGFSPDGNYLAVFARMDGGRRLLLLDVLNGGFVKEYRMEVDQQLGPTFSPDGRSIAFAGNLDGRFDLFLLDLESGEVSRLTDDELYDGAPTFSPDGKHIVYSSVSGAHPKLFRIAVDDPSQRVQLTTGESSDVDAVYSADGNRIYFTSDRDGFDNVYVLDMENEEIRAYTDVVTGAFMPAVLNQPDGTEEVVYTGFWKRSYKLYLSDLEEALGEPEQIALSEELVPPGEQQRYEPAIEVAIDDGNLEDYRGFKFFLENAATTVGVDSDQTFLGRIILQFTDYLGDQRIFAVLSSYDALSNFDFAYLDLNDRLQFQYRIFDDRRFSQFIVDQSSGRVLDRRGEQRVTGATAAAIYPFSLYSRVEGGVGYVNQKISLPVRAGNALGGVSFVELEDDFPFVFAEWTRDSATFAPWGPISGSRVNLAASWAPDLDESGTKTSTIAVDARAYIPTTLRTGFAFRGYGAWIDGNFGNFQSIGGWNTVRGFPLRSLTGDRVFFMNAEYRFPLIDLLATPVLAFQGVRGRVFLDVGGAYFDEEEDFDFWDSENDRLQDAVSVYGLGMTFRFLGLDLNWDFSKQWDFEQTRTGFETQFYIGTSF